MAMTYEQVLQRGLAVLRKELGRADLARFLQDFQVGGVDYTQERSGLLKDLTSEELKLRITKAKKKRRRA